MSINPERPDVEEMGKETERLQSELAEKSEQVQDANEREKIVRAEVRECREMFAAHTDAVGKFLSEMYAIMVDPLSDGEIKVKEVCAALLSAAKRDREQDNQLSEAKERERQLNNRIQTDQLAHNHDIEVLESSNARLREAITGEADILAQLAQDKTLPQLSKDWCIQRAKYLRDALQPPKEQG